MAKTTLKFNTYQREAKREPLDLELPNGETITVALPDGDLTMAIEEAGHTRKALRLAFGDQWPAVEPLVGALKDPEALREFTMDVLRGIGVAADDAPPAGGSR